MDPSLTYLSNSFARSTAASALLASCLCAAVATGATACSDDGGSGGGGPIGTGDTAGGDALGTDDGASQPDAGDADEISDPDASDLDGRDGSADGHTPPEIDVCASVVGDAITVDPMATVELSTPGQSNFDPYCGAAGEDVGETVVPFDVPAISRVTATVEDDTEWTIQSMSGECDDPAIGGCYAGSTGTFIAQTGESYLLSLEPINPAASADPTLTIQADPLACFPLESTRCDGDDVLTCQHGDSEARASCDLGCRQSACRYDICANAAGLDATGSQQFSGTLSGYGSQFDFSDRTDCSGSDNVGLATPGQDLVFTLDGLTAGQTVTVDASNDPIDNAIFVLDACAPDASCTAGGEQLDDKLEWSVPSDGDYVVVIDALKDVSGVEFDYSISIQ